jgi:hypothetical protein
MSAGIPLIRKFSARLNTLENAHPGIRNILKKTNTCHGIRNIHREKNMYYLWDQEHIAEVCHGIRNIYTEKNTLYGIRNILQNVLYCTRPRIMNILKQTNTGHGIRNIHTYKNTVYGIRNIWKRTNTDHSQLLHSNVKSFSTSRKIPKNLKLEVRKPYSHHCLFFCFLLAIGK